MYYYLQYPPAGDSWYSDLVWGVWGYMWGDSELRQQVIHRNKSLQPDARCWSNRTDCGWSSCGLSLLATSLCKCSFPAG